MKYIKLLFSLRGSFFLFCSIYGQIQLNIFYVILTYIKITMYAFNTKYFLF